MGYPKNKIGNFFFFGKIFFGPGGGPQRHTPVADPEVDPGGRPRRQTLEVGGMGDMPLVVMQQDFLVYPHNVYKHSRFPLIQSPFVKLTQLAEFNKPSEA